MVASRIGAFSLRSAQLEIKSEQVYCRKHDAGNAAFINMQRGEIDIAIVAQDAVKCTDSLPCRADDHSLVKRRV